MANSITITTKSLDETRALGKKIGQRLKGSELFAMMAELGGGKTSFTQGLAEGLSVVSRVTSPTFVLEKIYTKKPGDKPALYHYDLYRLGESEVADLDLWENIGHAPMVIEWSEKIEKDLPQDAIRVKISTQSETKRTFVFEFNDDQKYLFN